MGFFDALSFLLAAGFLVAAFVRQKVVGTEAFQKAMMLFLAALVLHDLVPGLPVVGQFLGVAARSRLCRCTVELPRSMFGAGGAGYFQPTRRR